MTYTPTYGAPGPGSGWEDGSSAGTEISGAALDNMEQGIIDASVAVDEIAPGAPGSRMVDVAKLPVGTTAGTVAAGDDSRLAGADPALVNALVIAYESSPGSGVYTRPNYDGPVGYLGVVMPTAGGTTAGGTGTSVAVTGKDVQLLVVT